MNSYNDNAQDSDAIVINLNVKGRWSSVCK